MDDRALLVRLHDLLQASARQYGETIDVIDPDTCSPDLEVYPVGRSGVIALVGGYLMAAWPREERAVASPAAYAHIRRWLEERGEIRHMVHWRNTESIIATRRLGADPQGVDQFGYIHYVTTLQDFLDRDVGSIRVQAQRAGDRKSNGQEVATPQGT